MRTSEAHQSRRHFMQTALLAGMTISGKELLLSQSAQGSQSHSHHSSRISSRTVISSMEHTPVQDSRCLPVLYFHGITSSKRDPFLLGSALPQCPGGFIAFDRPGTGCSTFVGLRNLNAWARYFYETIVPSLEYAHNISLRRFGIVALSAGTWFAIACAAAQPSRVESIAIMGGSVPGAPGVDRGRIYRIARKKPRLATTLTRLTLSRASTPNGYRRLARRMPIADVDKAFMSRHSHFFSSNLRDAVRCGYGGLVQDTGLGAYPWNVCFQNVSARVAIWNGTCDRVTTIQSGRYLTRQLPNAVFYAVPREGHLSILPSVFPVAIRFASGANPELGIG